MVVFSRIARSLRVGGRCVQYSSATMQMTASNLTRYVVLTLGLFTPVYLIGLERYMRQATFQPSDSSMPLPPPLGEDEAETVIEAEMKLQRQTLEGELLAQIKSGAMDDITMNHISDLISYHSQRKEFPHAIALAERLSSASSQPRVQKELRGTLALLYFEQCRYQPPAEAKKSRAKCRALAERTMKEKGVGFEGKATIANLLFILALWDQNPAEARRYLPLAPEDTQDRHKEELRAVEALPNCEEALRQTPDHFTALLQKGWAQLYMAQYDAAQATLTTALQLAPPPKELLQAVALNAFFCPADPFYTGVYLRQVGRRLEQAMAESPTLPVVNILCALHARVHADPEAVLNQFQSLLPGLSDTEVSRLLGIALATPHPHPQLTFSDRRLGEWFLQRGFQGADGYNAAYYAWLARLYRSVGDPVAEASCVKRGLDISPKSPTLRTHQQQSQLQYSRLVDLLLRRGRQN